MTQVSRDDVLLLAGLSNLQLADDELDGLVADISNILGYVEQLNELDTTDVEPTYQVTRLENIWRDDVAAIGDVSRNDLLALAPDSSENQIKVPKVL